MDNFAYQDTIERMHTPGVRLFDTESEAQRAATRGTTVEWTYYIGMKYWYIMHNGKCLQWDGTYK